MKLYEISDAYMSLLDADVSKEDMEVALGVIDEEFDKKIENIGKLIRQIEGDMQSLKDEEMRLLSKRKKLEKKEESLKDYIFSNFKAIGKDKVKTPLFTISVAKNPAKLVIRNENNLPDKYYKIEKKVDKAKLKEDIKNGVKVDEAELVQSEGVRIR